MADDSPVSEKNKKEARLKSPAPAAKRARSARAGTRAVVVETKKKRIMNPKAAVVVILKK